MSVATVFGKLQVIGDVTKRHLIMYTNQRLRSFSLAVIPQKSETFKQASNQDYTTTILATVSCCHKNWLLRNLVIQIKKLERLGKY